MIKPDNLYISGRSGEIGAAKDLEAAQAAFDDRMAAANQQTVNSLEPIARRVIADVAQLPVAGREQFNQVF